METPRTAKPRSLFLRSISINQGISILQGPHQVAKKSSSTTLPLYSSSRTVLPLASLRANSGAGWRSTSGFTLAACTEGVREQPVNRQAASSAAAGTEKRSASTDNFLTQLYRQRPLAQMA